MSDCDCTFCEDDWDTDEREDLDPRCFTCGAEDCICPPEQCPECGERCASLCIDDTCLRGECCCFHVAKTSQDAPREP